MYNEGEDLYARTMYGVQKNIQHLCTRTRSKMWGKDAWKKVVVVIVSDGRKKVNARTLSVLATQGIYQEGVATNIVKEKPVTCHVSIVFSQMTLADLFSGRFTSIQHKSQSLLTSSLKAQAMTLYRYKSSLPSKNKIRKRSTRTDGSSMPLPTACSPMW